MMASSLKNRWHWRSAGVGGYLGQRSGGAGWGEVLFTCESVASSFENSLALAIGWSKRGVLVNGQRKRDGGKFFFMCVR